MFSYMKHSPYKYSTVIQMTKDRPIDGFDYRAWHYKNYHVTKTGSHFVGQKGNQINRVSLVIQY